MERFPDNARVCFVGDSITHHNQHVARIIDQYFTDFPNCNIKFFNCGAAGGAVFNANDFLDDFVLSHNPTHIVVMFGVNDSRRWLLAERNTKNYDELMEAFEIFKREYQKFFDRVKERNIHLTVCTPPPYAEYQKTEQEPFHGGAALIQMYADFVKYFAEKNNIELLDMHEYMNRQLTKEDLFNPDHIHPNPHGHYRMAEFFLASQGIQIKEEAPLPEYLEEWRTETHKLCMIYAAEVMVTHNYFASDEEKMSLAQKFLDNPNSNPAVIPFAKEFLKYFPEKDRIQQKINQMTEAGLFRK